MSIEIRVPQLPESVTDATLVAWHKQAGDAISRDENLADLETDKVEKTIIWNRTILKRDNLEMTILRKKNLERYNNEKGEPEKGQF